MFARSAALAWPSASRAIAFHSLSMGATASWVIWMARSACCTARLGSGRGSSVRIRVYSRARGFGRRESPVRSPTASAVTLACTSRSSMATTGSRSAAGIRVNTFVRRARSGSSANSPSRRDADSSSVRTVSSGRASCWPGGRAIAIRASTIDRLCAMGLPVFVGSAFVAQYPTGGGNFWVPLQYLLGLRALGVEAHWLELLWARGDRRRALEFVRAFRGALERLGVAEWATIVCFPEGSRDDPPGHAQHHGLAPAELRARAREAYDCNKRPGFLALLDLPGRVPVALELAANLHQEESEDRALLARHGWRLADPAEVAGTPEAFRRYVQGSRGELSAAKPAYVKARPGWVSDRTICYLASGRPCVVEATGAERHLPPSPGLRFFRSLDDAADALRAVEADYAAAARAARRLAEEVFSSGVVLPELLAAAGA